MPASLSGSSLTLSSNGVPSTGVAGECPTLVRMFINAVPSALYDQDLLCEGSGFV